LGDKWIVGLASWSLGKVASAQGDYEAARSFFEESAAIGTELGNKWFVPYVLEGFGDLALAQGQPEKAARLFGAAEVLREELGLSLPPAERRAYDSSISRMNAAMTAEAFRAAWADGCAIGAEQAMEMALERVEAGGPVA